MHVREQSSAKLSHFSPRSMRQLIWLPLSPLSELELLNAEVVELPAHVKCTLPCNCIYIGKNTTPHAPKCRLAMCQPQFVQHASKLACLSQISRYHACMNNLWAWATHLHINIFGFNFFEISNIIPLCKLHACMKDA